MKMRLAILSALSAVLLVALSACQTASPGGGGGGTHPPASASCASPAPLPTTISSPMTLTAGCYEPTDGVSVDAALTIDAGVTILMPAGSYFDIGYGGTAGSLNAQGTAASPIVFEGNVSNASRGYWVGIEIYSKSTAGAPNVLNHTTVADGGSYSADSGDVSLYNGSATITNSTFQNSSAFGIFADGVSTLPGFSANKIDGNARGAMEIPAQDMSDLDVATTYNGNTVDVVDVAGTVDHGSATTVHWPGIDVPFYATDSISLDSPVVVDAGFVMQADAGNGIYLDVGYGGTAGALNAQGTASDPVVFEGSAGNPDDWVGIEIYSKSTAGAPNVLNHTTVADGGSYSADSGDVSLYNGSATITNSTFQNSSAFGIFADGVSTLPGFSANKIDGNARGAMEIPAQDMSDLDVATTYNGNTVDVVDVAGTVDHGSATTVHWPGIDVPFHATDAISLDSPVVVDAGFVMKMDAGTYLDVGYGGTAGRLNAQGTSTDPVVFQGYGTSPGPGYWDAITFYTPSTGSATNVLNHAIVMDGGSGAGDVVVGSSADATVTNSRIGDSGSAGICVDPARQSFSQSGNTFVSPYSVQVDTSGSC